MLDGGTTIDIHRSAGTGLFDVHTHAVNVDLPDLRQSYPADSWPSIERTGAATANLMFGGQRYRQIDHRCWSPDARIADMDHYGVAVQVLSPIPVTFCYRASASGAAELASAQNEFFGRIVQQHPTRFAALGAVPLQDPDLAVEEMRRCMRRPGFLGVEIGTQVVETELGDPSLDRFFAVAHELGAMVLVHPSDQDLSVRVTTLGLGFGAGMPIETALAAAALLTGGALARRPEVRLCLAHGGGALPAMIGRLDQGARLAGNGAGSPDLPSRLAGNGAGSPDLPSRLAGRLWCDSLTYDRSALNAVVQLFGHDHVVFGSDYPFPAMPEPIDDIVADLPADLRRRISRTNLEEHYGVFPGAGLDSLSAAGRDRRPHGGPPALDID
ncbi:amidohydrolase family protein [[Mycobacterium] nativiensis]|uniref:2-amino-3-carboxymuconate-6-semialdehyde decarboxylase n=1 Tax=[Mycobacterium] nativiensis TaxID=2855503 RepID=A0ABU5XQ65_9MYCO|nr:amidohydrolase family protein [Mycolicibacter sp. MYC340]MEB3030058.1 amidohydrolase family protein [Mycolicibacter sp. MYC340]